MRIIELIVLKADNHLPRAIAKIALNSTEAHSTIKNSSLVKTRAKPIPVTANAIKKKIKPNTKIYVTLNFRPLVASDNDCMQ